MVWRGQQFPWMPGVSELQDGASKFFWVGAPAGLPGAGLSTEVLPISISEFLKLFDIILIQKGTGMGS